MNMGIVLRVARPTDNLERLVRMYVEGLDLEVLDSFENHNGFDGVIVGLRHGAYHLEFTSHRGHPAGAAPGAEHLLVFYLPDDVEWNTSCQRLEAAGFRSVTPVNPFWHNDGRTFEDIDGYRVVLQHTAWTV